MTTDEVQVATVDTTIDAIIDGSEAELVDESREKAISEAVRAAQYSRVDDLRELLDSGALTANTKDAEDCTLLQWAAINNRSVIINELMSRGADVNATGGFLKVLPPLLMPLM